MLNSEFICVIGTVPTYLGNWGKRVNFGNGVAKIQQKYEREREKVGERKFWISVITLPKFLLPKPADRKPAEIGEKKICGNCGNAIAENGREKKKIVVAEIWGGIKKRDKTYFRPYIFTRFPLWSLTFFFTAFSPCLEKRLLF